ncbi:MAG: glycoside hydrolase family 3 protein, partial [Selenomonadaceae bacterium]|nr:glycoside hydrolase family 3 protein [Selenomonadaceae bacterium]
MGKKFFRLFALILVSVFICGCLAEDKVVTADMRGGKISSPDSVEAPTADPIEETLKSMTLAEKIGQMVFIGVHGTELNDDIRYSLNTFHFGGVIFFDRNMENVAQTKKLADDLQTLAGQKIPLLIALDEEGGRVARGKTFLEPAPSQESIGLDGDVTAATYWAQYNVNLLRSVGVNVNFAPVADVGSRDTRSFSDDAQIVAEFVEASAQGYESENFLYTLKHFPGIGRGKVDSHKEVSSIEVGRDILEAEDFLPFKKIISGHDNSKFMVMVGHLKYDALDAETSASLSPAVMTDLL